MQTVKHGLTIGFQKGTFWRVKGMLLMNER